MVSFTALTVLYRAAGGNECCGLKGCSLNYGQQSGHTRQINWLLKHKWVKLSGTRIVATREGKKQLKRRSEGHQWCHA